MVLKMSALFAACCVASLVLASAPSHAAPPQNPNPTNDPDVQAGYDRTTKEIHDRRAQEGTSNGTSTAPGGTDRSEHDHGHADCPGSSVCSDQSTYKNDPNSTPPKN